MTRLHGKRIAVVFGRLMVVAACLLAADCFAAPAAAAGSSKKLTPEQEEFRKTLTPQDRALLEGREMTSEERQQMNPYDAIRAKLEEKDRREYYRPAPPDFKPEDNARKLKLTLVPESRILRKGKPFRYRVEVQNIGNKPVYFGERGPAFLKTGEVKFEKQENGYKFYVTDPDGVKHPAEPSLLMSGSPPGSDYVSKPMTREEADKFEKVLALQTFEETEGFYLAMDLQPGDALISKEYYSKEIASFRDLRAVYKLDKPGTYRFQVIYDDPPPQHPKEKLKDLAKEEKYLLERLSYWRKPDKFILEENQKVYPHFSIQRVRELRQISVPSDQRRLKETRAKLKRGVTKKDIEEYERERLEAWGRVESNVVEIEVVQ